MEDGNEMKSRLQIRRSKYHGKDGWLICGTEPDGWRTVSIFVEGRKRAERIREKVRRGEEITLKDFQE